MYRSLHQVWGETVETGLALWCLLNAVINADRLNSRKCAEILRSSITTSQTSQSSLVGYCTSDRHGPLSKSSPDELLIGQVNVERVASFKLLGIHITSDLKWNIHIDKICAKASTRLYFFKNMKRAGLAVDQLRHFYLSAIRPILEYCSVVWHHGLIKTQAEQLEAVQRRAMRIIFEFTFNMPYQFAMAYANNSPLHARREDLNKKFPRKIH